jgi:hypothetical protein
LGSSSVRIPALAILAAILLTVLSGSASFAQETRIGKFTGDAKRGKDLYRRCCVGCHGPEGNGLGENASYLEPRPAISLVPSISAVPRPRAVCRSTRTYSRRLSAGSTPAACPPGIRSPGRSALTCSLT